MPEWSNGADSKSVGRHSWPGGSNPSFSAGIVANPLILSGMYKKADKSADKNDSASIGAESFFLKNTSV
jgi:hypothetical protein